MSEPSDPNGVRNALRDQIIGLGVRSVRKSYYPQLQQQIDELQKAKAALEEKSDSLLMTLKDLEAARQRAEESERRFRTLFEGIIDGVVVADPETQRYRMVNPAYCQMLGYTEAELLQLTIPDIHPPEALPGLMEELAKHIHGASFLLKNLPYKRKDGTIFYADVNTTAIDLENRHCMLGVCRDITERKQAEQKLQRSEADLERAQAIAHLGSWSWDIASGQFLWSDEMYRIFGVDPAAFGATLANMVALIHPDDLWKRERAFSQSLSGQPAEPYDYRIVRPDGTERVVEIKGMELEVDPEGHPRRMFGVAQDITERKQAQEALIREQKFNRALVENMVDAVVACNADFELTLFNRAARELHGVDAMRLPPEQWPEYYHLFCADGVTPMPIDEVPLTRAFRGAILLNEPMVIRAVGQPPRYVLANSAPFFDETGRKLGAVAVMHDITQRKAAEEALKREEVLTNAIFDSVPGLIYLYDDNGMLVRWNKQHEKITGYTPEELSRMHVLDWYRGNEEDAALIARSVEKCRTEGYAEADANLQTKSGEKIRFHFTAVHLEIDGKGYFAGIGIDITEQRRAEEELHRLNRLYAVLSQVNQAVIHAGSQQELLEQVCKISIEFGAFRMTWVGKVNPETHQVIPIAAAGDYRGFLDKVSVYADDRPEGRGTVGISIREERTFVSNDFLGFPGTRPWLELATKFGFRAIASFPLRNAGKIYGALVVYADELDFFQDKEVKLLEEVASDISFALDLCDQEAQRKQDEVALKQAKEDAEAANRAKDQFIAVLSHELRTPLTPVLTTIALLQSHEELPDETRGELETIRRNVELEAKLIDDLLDVTRISRGIVELHREEVDVHACIMKALEICRSEIAEKGVEVSLSLHAKAYHVWADSARLQQVFWNLVKNAVKFTSTEGRISIRTTNTDNWLKIEVADTGIGIEPEVLPRIFNAFEQGEKTSTRRFGGLGLGLSIAKAIVELHKGSISASSEGQNKGAVFTVKLETMDSAPVTIVSGASTRQQKDGQHKILLVEDNADTLRILSRLLQKWGYVVKCSDCVAKALDLAASESFDLLVSDIGLPDGSGLDIMRETQERYGLRGIALSGFGTDDDLRLSRAAGFEEHLTKPVGVEGLRAAVERIVSANRL